MCYFILKCVSDYVVKPFTIKAISDKLDKILK